MRRLGCEDFDQPISDQVAKGDDNTEYVEILDNTAYIQVGDRVAYGSPPYLREFTQADLTMDSFVINHNLLVSNGVVKIILFNDAKLEVQPSDVEIIDANNARVSLKGYTPITGNWRLKAV